MARPRTHSDDQILGAVRTLLLEKGPRGVTVAAVSERSGAPTGTLYHRYGSRANMVAALWIRTVRQLQEAVLAAAEAAAPGVERAVAMALGTVDYSGAHPEDAKLLTLASRERLQHTSGLSTDNASALSRLNEPLHDRLRLLVAELDHLPGTPGAVRQQVTFAVLSIPYVAVRQAVGSGADIAAMRPLVETAVRAVLAPDGPEPTG